MKTLLFLCAFFVLFAPLSTASSAINKMSYAGCACVCNGDELALSDNLVIVADAGKGLLFQYTPDGTFAGFIGSAINCKPAYPFKPTRIIFDGNQYHALNMASKTIDVIGTNGDRFSSVSLVEAGLGLSMPTSLAYGNDTVYLSFNNSKILACDYELTVSYESQLTNVVALFHRSDRLYALTSKGEVQTFDDQLKKLDTPASYSYLPGFLKDPQDIFVDLSDNIWIADTGNKRIVVLWSDGGFSTWGQTAKSYDLTDLSGDPISGKQNTPLVPRRVVALSDFFFISTPDHQSYSIPFENLTKKQEFGRKHLLSLRMSADKYRKHQQSLWNLQQDIYPQTAVMVTLDNQNESVFVNGNRIDASIDEICSNDDSISCILDNTDNKVYETVKFYTEQGHLVFERERASKDFIIVVINRISGGNNPLQTELLTRFAIMPEDLKASVKLPSIQKDTGYIASIFDNNGKFLDFFFIRSR